MFAERALPATRDVDQKLVQCWAAVVDGGPTLSQSLVNVLCLLGDMSKDLGCFVSKGA